MMMTILVQNKNTLQARRIDLRLHHLVNFHPNYLITVFRLGKCLIRHNKPWKMKWDLYVMLLAVWNCFSIPFEVAFDPDEPW